MIAKFVECQRGPWYPARGLTVMALFRHEALLRGWTLRIIDIQNPRVNRYMQLYFKDQVLASENRKGYEP